MKIQIPTEVMEQEFALHNRRGYSDGYKAAKHQASIELAAMRAQLDAVLAAMSGMAALQANPPMKVLANPESYEAGRVMEREACAKVCETLLGPTATDFYGKTYAAAIRARGGQQ